MINYFRELNKTFGYIVFALIAASFAFFGLGGLLTGKSSAGTTNVNGKPISPAAIQQQTQNLVYEYYNQTKQRPSSTVMKELKQQALMGLVNYQVGLDVAHSLGLSIHSSVVNELITKNPAFTDEGLFNRDKLNQYLTSTNTSESDFYYQYYQSLLSEQLENVFSNTAFTTEKEMKLLNELTKRSITLVPYRIDRSTVPIDHVSEEDIVSYYNKHEQEFKTQPKAKISWIKLSLESFFQEAVVSMDDVRDQYLSHQELYTKPRHINTRTVLLTNEQSQSYEKLKTHHYSSFDELCHAISVMLSSSQASEMHESDEMSQHAKTGMHFTRDINGGRELVWVESVLEAELSPLSSVQSKIKSELQSKYAQEHYLAAMDRLSDLSYSEAHGLNETAHDLGVALSSDTLLLDGSYPEGIHKNIKLYDLINQLRESQSNSSLIQAGQEAYVFSLDSYMPSESQPLEKVRSAVKQSVVESKKKVATSKYRKTILASMQKTTSPSSAKKVARKFYLQADKPQVVNFTHVLTAEVEKLFVSKPTKFSVKASESSDDLIYLVTYTEAMPKKVFEFPYLIGQSEFATSFSDWLNASEISLAQ